ncbi:hypothetical protein TYRP_005020 [Tyrophagus putrescentiae]|nr:hypothetical protein TYRP_005020 [Tyrophagus putrescentiae]
MPKLPTLLVFLLMVAFTVQLVFSMSTTATTSTANSSTIACKKDRDCSAHLNDSSCYQGTCDCRLFHRVGKDGRSCVPVVCVRIADCLVGSRGARFTKADLYCDYHHVCHCRADLIEGGNACGLATWKRAMIIIGAVCLLILVLGGCLAYIVHRTTSKPYQKNKKTKKQTAADQQQQKMMMLKKVSSINDEAPSKPSEGLVKKSSSKELPNTASHKSVSKKTKAVSSDSGSNSNKMPKSTSSKSQK